MKWNQQWFIDTGKPCYDTHNQLALLYEFAVKSNARRILELGVGDYGISTFALLKAVEKTDGHLISVDNRGTCGSYYINPRWEFINAASETVSLDGQFDLILLDTSHTAQATTIELAKYVPMVKSDGYLFVHDTEWVGVSEPLKFYLEDNPNVLEFILKQDESSQMSIYKKLC